jgi:hypothetical protein
VRRLLASACLLAALPLGGAGCGNERQDAPNLPPAAQPSGQRLERLRGAGVAFTRPRNWRVSPGHAPQLVVVSSGRAFVTLWRYRRVESLPRSDEELVQARRALVNAARARDRTLRVLSARLVRHGAVPGIQLVATERIGSSRRQVRSTHLYADGAELVIDAYAPLDEFAQVDRTTFLPLLRSLRVTRPPLPSSS